MQVRRFIVPNNIALFLILLLLFIIIILSEPIEIFL